MIIVILEEKIRLFIITKIHCLNLQNIQNFNLGLRYILGAYYDILNKQRIQYRVQKATFNDS